MMITSSWVEFVDCRGFKSVEKIHSLHKKVKNRGKIEEMNEFRKGRKKTGGIKKGQKQTKTKIKELISEKTYEEATAKVMQNIVEMIFSPKSSVREKATKDYANYFLPTKTHNKNENFNSTEYEKRLLEIIEKAND